jgi:hypothetical protein
MPLRSELMTFDDEHLLKVAQSHGEDHGELDYEVGDLQQFFRAAWALLTVEQKSAFFASDAVEETYEGATGSTPLEVFKADPFAPAVPKRFKPH